MEDVHDDGPAPPYTRPPTAIAEVPCPTRFLRGPTPTTRRLAAIALSAEQEGPLRGCPAHRIRGRGELLQFTAPAVRWGEGRQEGTGSACDGLFSLARW